MDFRQLEVFAKVVEIRSFSRAAEALRLTQSTVSEHVRLLEEEIGARLCDRLGRETLPTRAGELLHGYAQRMLALRTEAIRPRSTTAGTRIALGASAKRGAFSLPVPERPPVIGDVARISRILLDLAPAER